MDGIEGVFNITIKNILNLKMPHSQNIYKYKIINNKTNNNLERIFIGNANVYKYIHRL